VSTTEELASALRQVLERRPDVRFALLFGSTLTRGPERARDVDVAVSFTEPKPLLLLGRLEGDLERAAGREIDVVDIDRATTLLRWEVARGGQVLVCRDRDELTEFRARASLEYLDIQPHRERQARGLRRALGLPP
jgi:predicted nucleotidyltransferase